MSKNSCQVNLVEISFPNTFSALYLQPIIQSRKCLRKSNLNEITLSLKSVHVIAYKFIFFNVCLQNNGDLHKCVALLVDTSVQPIPFAYLL